MTNYSARLAGKIPETHNKKDSTTGQRRRDTSADWTSAGFEWVEGTRSTYLYSWGDGFPEFKVAPGTITVDDDYYSGLIVTYRPDIIEYFQYGTSPKQIKQRLDDLSAEIMQYDAELAEAPLEEINIDLWMTRAAAAARQRTPAVRDLAGKHGINLDVADEIILERGE